MNNFINEAVSLPNIKSAMNIVCECGEVIVPRHPIRVVELNLRHLNPKIIFPLLDTVL